MGVVDGLALGGRGVPRSKNNERSGWGCGKRLILGTSRGGVSGYAGQHEIMSSGISNRQHPIPGVPTEPAFRAYDE